MQKRWQKLHIYDSDAKKIGQGSRSSSPLFITVSVMCACSINQIYRLPGQVNLVILATSMIKDVSWHAPNGLILNNRHVAPCTCVSCRPQELQQHRFCVFPGASMLKLNANSFLCHIHGKESRIPLETSKWRNWVSVIPQPH